MGCRRLEKILLERRINMKSDILIIGVSPAGLAAGITAAQHGFKL